MITCRICGEKAAVAESSGNGNEWIRIRRCTNCGRTFYTCEQEIAPGDGDTLFKQYARERFQRMREKRRNA